MPATKDRPPPRFTTVQTIPLEWAPFTITQYGSTRTGMRVNVVDVKGPKVEGHFALATEIHDNSGAPHTLEHLVFMGSKNYHYKGLLDRLSSRSFSYTNAWTATDHTAYVLKTAGWEGFAQILPIYLEHVLVPTLTDEGCYTEVHHVDGAGNDAGVVYAEMQGTENSSGDLMDLRARELLYPKESGFRSETGGIMAELRSLTADRIRAYHKEMYQPKNLRVVITGEIDHDELLNILDEFETSILDDVPPLDAPFSRPWIDSEPTPVLSETKIETCKFPEEDESMGEILIGYIGPKGMDAVANSAMNTLLTYLCGSSISILWNTLVEREALCGSIGFSTDNRPDMALWFYMSAVETEKLRTVYDRLVSLLQEIAKKPLDMPYLHDCLRRAIRQIKRSAESSGEFFSTPCIEDHLFGRRDGTDLDDLKSLKDMEVLLEWPEARWVDFLKHWISDAKHVAVLGEPSKELADKISSDEKARAAAQKERLGEDGLKKLADKLKEAQDINDKPIPDSVLEQWPVPSTDSVHFFPTTTARSGRAQELGHLDNKIQKIIDTADDGSPLFLHFEHIPSNFVSIRIFITTHALPVELRPILPLYFSNLFTTPVTENGKRKEFEDVVLDLERETTSYATNTAYGNQETIVVSVSTEPANYESVISKLRTIFLDAIHDPVRLHASLTRILASLPSEKRDGDTMVWAINSMVNNDRAGYSRASNTLTKTVYLKRLRKLLKEDEATVIAKFEQLCKTLHQPENFRVFVAADVEKLPNPVSTWQTFTRGMDLSKPLNPLVDLKSTLSEKGRNPGSSAYVVPISACDSSFGLLTSKGPDRLDHPDVPALTVAIALLSATEGPLWVAVRGKGLAYGANFLKSFTRGYIIFSIYKSPDPYKAYAAAKAEIEGFASGERAINKFAMESAVSETVYEMASDQDTMGMAAYESFLTQVLRGVEKDYPSQLLAKVSGVTPGEVREVMGKYLVPLFQPPTANLVVTCSTIMEEKVVANFREAGFAPEAKGLEFFQDDYGLEAPEGEEEAEEEEDDEVDDDEDDDDDEEEA